MSDSPVAGPPDRPGAHAAGDAMTSRWTGRQQALLDAIGLRAWPPLLRASSPAPAEASSPKGPASRPTVAVDVRHSEPAVAAPALAASAAGDRDGPLPTLPGVALSARAARPRGVDQMDWVGLQSAVAGCRACRLCEGRTQTVFGTGSPRAHWMVVGEAPGEQEDRQGEPFVGKSGHLLDAMLASLGLSRDPAAPAERAVYIANAVKCRPPGNRNPQPDEMAQCEPYLVRQVALLQPRLILAMGRFAVQSLLRSDEAIGRLRGRVHQYEGVPLIVTYHPAYLLRNPQDKARAWDDLCRARHHLALAARRA
jgi:uracil-DNA glycosylase